jgi:hypothetical protein
MEESYFDGRKESSLVDCEMRSQVHRAESFVNVRPEGVLLHGLAPVQALVQNVDDPEGGRLTWLSWIKIRINLF